MQAVEIRGIDVDAPGGGTCGITPRFGPRLPLFWFLLRSTRCRPTASAKVSRIRSRRRVHGPFDTGLLDRPGDSASLSLGSACRRRSATSGGHSPSSSSACTHLSVVCGDVQQTGDCGHDTPLGDSTDPKDGGCGSRMHFEPFRAPGLAKSIPWAHPGRYRPRHPALNSTMTVEQSLRDLAEPTTVAGRGYPARAMGPSARVRAYVRHVDAVGKPPEHGLVVGCITDEEHPVIPLDPPRRTPPRAGARPCWPCRASRTRRSRGWNWPGRGRLPNGRL